MRFVLKAILSQYRSSLIVPSVPFPSLWCPTANQVQPRLAESDGRVHGTFDREYTCVPLRYILTLPLATPGADFTFILRNGELHIWAVNTIFPETLAVLPDIYQQLGIAT